MRFMLACVVALGLTMGSTVAVGHLNDTGGTLAAQTQTPNQSPTQAQVQQPTVDPAETNPAAWATLIWIAVGLIFLMLLVGGILLSVRSTGDRRPLWRRGTRE